MEAIEEEYARSKFLLRLKCCCFCNRNVSLTSGSPPTVLLCAGSGKGIPSLLVKYGPSSSRFPPALTPETLAMMEAGPSLALLKKEDRWT